jgi:hypothetical protein
MGARIDTDDVIDAQGIADLQRLLADNVQLLPGAQINRGNPRLWLLVKRGAGFPITRGRDLVVNRSSGR